MLREIVLALSCAVVASANGMNLGFGLNTVGVIPSGPIGPDNLWEAFRDRMANFSRAQEAHFNTWLKAWENTQMGGNMGDPAYNAMGTIQCPGFDHTFGIPLFQILAILKGDVDPNNDDFGGDSLCHYTCDGQCEAYESMSNGAEVSAYPFGCICNQKPGTQRCDANGPMIDHKAWPIPGTDINCTPSVGCSNYCASTTANTQSSGYLCNWWNVDNTFYMDPTLSAIRWCSCC